MLSLEQSYLILQLELYEKNIDIIKKKYKSLILLYHPDKLFNVIDEKEKLEKIEKFKNINEAYKIIIDYINNAQEYDINDDMTKYFDELFNFFKTVEHKINVPITYLEYYKNSKKKIRLVLKNTEEPLYFYLFCKDNFPIHKINKTINKTNHNIIINLIFEKDNIYTHNILNKNIIDLHTTIDITLLNYIEGFEYSLPFIDDTIIKINKEPFDLYNIEKSLDSLNNLGMLNISFTIKNIEKEKWNLLNEDTKKTFISILNTL